MNKEELIKYISNKLNSGQEVEFEYQIKGVPYKIKFLARDTDRGINIPSILAIPLSQNINNQLIV